MIRYYKHSDIDFQKWNRCVDYSRPCSVFFKSEYLDIYAPDWAALIENDYETVMPLSQRQKYGLTYIYPPSFALPLPIISLNNQLDYTMFLQSIPKRITLVDMVLKEKAIYPNQFGKFEHQSFKLNLENSYQNLYAHYSENTKRNLKKGKLNNFEIRQTLDLDLMVQLFKDGRGSKKDVHYTNEDYTMLEILSKKLCQDGFLESESLYYQGEFCGGVLWLKDVDTYYFWFSSTHSKYKSLYPLFILIDHFIMQKAGFSGYIDFKGSNQSNLARFYQSFGGMKYIYPQIIFSPKMQFLTHFFKVYKKFN